MTASHKRFFLRRMLNFCNRITRLILYFDPSAFTFYKYVVFWKLKYLSVWFNAKLLIHPQSFGISKYIQTFELSPFKNINSLYSFLHLLS